MITFDASQGRLIKILAKLASRVHETLVLLFACLQHVVSVTSGENIKITHGGSWYF